MKKIIAFLGPLSIAVILVAATCKNAHSASDCLEKAMKADCVCYEIYKPVCGCNGKTYANDCVARCQNITQFKEGACPK
jgi:Kazal-type serine protease inhibitor domain